MQNMRFVWISDTALPVKWDLTTVGWDEVAVHRVDDRTVWLYDWSEGGDMDCPMSPERALCVAVGVDRTQDRARLLANGVAEAVSSDIELVELAWRLIRIVREGRRTDMVRHAGPIELDLLRRDGVLAGRRMMLEPRIFAVLWTLAECPGKDVESEELRVAMRAMKALDEAELERALVNTRERLMLSGLAWLIETHADGRVRLTQRFASSFAGFPNARRESLTLDSARAMPHQGEAIARAG